MTPETRGLLVLLGLIAAAFLCPLVGLIWAITLEDRREFNAERARRDVEELLANANTEVFTRPRVHAALFNQPNESEL